jgi:hypothetical protein
MLYILLHEARDFILCMPLLFNYFHVFARLLTSQGEVSDRAPECRVTIEVWLQSSRETYTMPMQIYLRYIFE